MTTEEFWKKSLTVGKMIRRISDKKYFEVVAIKEVKGLTLKYMEWTLEGESGSRMQIDSHWLDCYYSPELQDAATIDRLIEMDVFTR